MILIGSMEFLEVLLMATKIIKTFIYDDDKELTMIIMTMSKKH